jgi:hypothetical protein
VRIATSAQARLFVVFAAVVCGVATATYALAGRLATGHATAATPSGPAPVAKPPTAAEFAQQFVGVTNAYAQAHGETARLAQPDCVQASPGHYMCSYVITSPSRPAECHIMQAVWTPEQASTFRVTLAGKALRCGSLREALRSLE